MQIDESYLEVEVVLGAVDDESVKRLVLIRLVRLAKAHSALAEHDRSELPPAAAEAHARDQHDRCGAKGGGHEDPPIGREVVGAGPDGAVTIPISSRAGLVVIGLEDRPA